MPDIDLAVLRKIAEQRFLGIILSPAELDKAHTLCELGLIEWVLDRPVLGSARAIAVHLLESCQKAEADLAAATAERDAILADRDRLFGIALEIYRDINFPSDTESFQIWTRLKAALEGERDDGKETI